MESKVCAVCGKEKALDQFYKDKKSPDGRTRDCAECRREYMRERRRKDRDKGTTIAKPCAICGRPAQKFKVWVDEGNVNTTALCDSCNKLALDGAIALNYHKLPVL